jgi:urea carboxylase
MKTRYRIAGDHFLVVNYGSSFSLRNSFNVIVLCDRLRKMECRGIRGISSSINSLMIDYDPFEIATDDLIQEVRKLEDETQQEKEVLASRVIRMPVVYGDQWTRSCAQEFQASPNLDFVAEYNKMSVDELIQMHASSSYRVIYIGFTPGLPSFVPIDPSSRITAPKYKVPRTRTPKGTLGIGGILQCIYPLESPGGYQMLGRTPLLIYDLKRSNPIFKDDIILFRPGDRIAFFSISHADYQAIERNFSSYAYQIENEDWTLNSIPSGEGSADV